MAFSPALALLLAQAAAAPASPVDPASALSLIHGDWQITDAKGEVTTTCDKPQRFVVSSDRRTVALSEAKEPPVATTYLVVHDERDRVLMFIVNEKRKAASGDPVLWWATFWNADEFRWRRYDWGPDNVTAAIWKRCK